MTFGEVLLLTAALFTGAAAQAMTGMGLGLVSGAALVIVLGRTTAVPLLAALSIITMAPILVATFRSVRWRDAAFLAVPAVALTWPLSRALASVDEALVARGAGLAIFAASLALAMELRIRRLTGRLGALLASVTSSFLNVAAGMGAPPLTLYVANANWGMAATRGTLQVYFLAIGLAVLWSMPLQFSDPWTPAWCAVAVLGGSLGGTAAARRVPERAARLSALALAAAGGLALGMTSS